MTENQLRVVIDTSVLVAGFRSARGASYQILSMLPHYDFRFLLSVPLFLEYESVLKRETQIAAHGITIGDIDDFLNVLAALAEPTRLHYLWRPQLRDSADEMILETAINGQADGIVTHNTRDFVPAAGRFGIILWTPGDFLEKVRSST